MATFTLAIVLVQEEARIFQNLPKMLRCMLTAYTFDAQWYIACTHIQQRASSRKKGDRPFSLECSAGGPKPANTQYANIETVTAETNTDF